MATPTATRAGEPATDHQDAHLSYLTPKAIQPHPSNPRRRAVADDELVTSVKEHGLVQPLVVAVLEGPGSDTKTGNWSEGRYLLIGGHRRLAAAKKAKLAEVPCVVRRDLDTDAKQIEAMILENSSRVDLTPIEEAEGFASLLELGHKQKDIARITGKSARTVSDRLKLLKLSSSTKKRVHEGQMTIEDATAIVEFADDPVLTKRLEQASTGHSFKYDVQRARQNRKAEADTAALVAELLARGLTQVAPGADRGAVNAAGIKNGARMVFESTMDRHDDTCLRFGVHPASEYSASSVVYFCTHPDGHADQLSEEESARAAEEEAGRREREQRARDIAAASAHRIQTMTEAFGSVHLPPELVDLVRATLPAVLDRVDRFGGYGSGTFGEIYQELAGVDAGARWDGIDKKAERTKYLEHLSEISIGEVATSKVLVAALLTLAEACVAETSRYDDRLKQVGAAAAGAYFDTLDQLGHEWSPIDDEYRVRHGHLEPAAEPEVAS